MTLNEKKSLAKFVIKTLTKTYPNAKIELTYQKDDVWQLLVVVILSAQTTDKKVNEISPQFFKHFKTVYDIAKAEPFMIEPYIKSIGLYKNKAKHLVLAAQKIISDFYGEVPRTRAELETLPGVGQKTSAVVVANAFNEPAIAVDTHVARIARRLGLTKETNANKIETELMEIIDRKKWILAHHTFIFHGRRICFAKKPHCSICPLNKKCPQVGVKANY
jgi:endonuclease-3